MQNIPAIIGFIDSYLERSGRSYVEPPEANALLSRAGLLADNPDRPGLPLRNLLRAGHLPHAYQENGKGSKWVIPHSRGNGNARTGEATATKKGRGWSGQFNRSKPDQTVAATTSLPDLPAVLNVIRRNRFEPTSWERAHLPDQPGVYLICLNKGSKLPITHINPCMERFEGLDVIYAGISVGSLRTRDYAQHFNGSAGRSTLRKSLGVLFGFRLIPRDKDPLSGKTKFNDADEAKLSHWMRTNLTMFYVTSADCRRIEGELIRHFCPPLNLKENNNPINAEFRRMLKEKRTER